MPSDTFALGDLTAIIGDNDAKGEHRAGYNGLWSLTHKTDPANAFVPTVAGMNFEHIFDGETLDTGNSSDVFFEPRKAKMTFKKVNATTAELRQEATPTFKLESTTRFTLREPDSIDFHFKFRATQHVFKRGYLGLFWASYINAPEDKSMYLRGKNLWLQHCTPAHNSVSTVVHAADKFEMTFDKGHRDTLYKSLSPLKYDVPLFYGLIRKHILIVMFDRTDLLRTDPQAHPDRDVRPHRRLAAVALAQRRRREHGGPDDQPGVGLPVRVAQVRGEHRLRIPRPPDLPRTLLTRPSAEGIRHVDEGVEVAAAHGFASAVGESPARAP
ncbi:MAG: hypothetical protein FJ304_12475 [Planctomycetes bacterium]|nr:hypothetical protein [Planctomycetota bacterium]